jgi:hypothetical protein
MEQMKFVGRNVVENGKKKMLIEVIHTKIGNNYVVLRNAKYMKMIPYECLLCFCEQFESTKVASNEEINRLMNLENEIRSFLENKNL